MEYNSKLEPIALPEYGRNVQNMVRHCMNIEDRDQRNRAAQRIIHAMRALSPSHLEAEGAENIYWDHLAIISDFKLDIDYPEGTITEEKARAKIDRLPYTSHKARFRYYGHIIEGMIERVCKMEPGKQRAMLEYFIALQMKRSYMTWNRDTVEDLTIFKDLFVLSDGAIMLTPENCKLVINPNSIDRGGKQKIPKKMLKLR